MNYLVVDIETVPMDIKDEVIREYLMDKQISREMRCFNPLYSKIICIGLKPKDKETIILSGDNERKILEEFWDIVKDYNIVVTHNGYGFDIPFLMIRSVINQVKNSIKINTNKFNMENSNHFDTMLFFSQNIFTNPRLDIIAKTLGINIGENRFTGAEVERLYKEGKMNEIVRHCKEDIELAEKIYLFVKSY
jgi:3'-5' exonuclease